MAGYILIIAMSMMCGALYVSIMHPGVVCVACGHDYPLVSLWSSIMAALHDPEEALKQEARVRHTCLRCGEMGEEAYHSYIERVKSEEEGLQKMIRGQVDNQEPVERREDGILDINDYSVE